MNKIIQKTYQKEVKSWLKKQHNKSLLRLLACGSVDDGKSTLIGRILHDTKQIYEDQLSLIKKDSKKYGNQNEGLMDFSLLVDGLQSEREQGITIDVAYRYFDTNNRKFILVDTPGHEQYTKNMATGASNCDLAIILIDARKGVLKQTKKHSFISTLLGIKYLIVAINKMDLIQYNENIFNEIKKDFLEFSKKLPKKLIIKFIPISALLGINIVKSGISWYKEQNLLEIIENIEIKKNFSKKIRFPIQYIIRYNLDFRGYAGTLESGEISIGQKIKILPSGLYSNIKDIISSNKKIKKATFGQPIIITLTDNIDISRGDLIVSFNDNIETTQKVSINIVWMDNKPLLVGNSYKGKIYGKNISLKIEKIHYQVNPNNLVKNKVNQLLLNDIGLVDIIFHESIAVDLYKDNKVTGGMIIIDCVSNNTVGAGMISIISKKYYQKNNKFSEFEIELNKLIIRYFPHWKIKKLLEYNTYE